MHDRRPSGRRAGRLPVNLDTSNDCRRKQWRKHNAGGDNRRQALFLDSKNWNRSRKQMRELQYEDLTQQAYSGRSGKGVKPAPKPTPKRAPKPKK